LPVIFRALIFGRVKSEHENIDRDSAQTLLKFSPELFKAVMSTSSGKSTKGKTRKQKKRMEPQRNSGVDHIYQELEHSNSFALAEARKVIRDTIQEPLPNDAWTKELEGYEDARTSAENALRRMWDGTDGVRAVSKGNPWLSFCLYKIRAGLLRADSPEILRCVQHAQNIGKAEWFFDRAAAELKNAKKRVPGAPRFNQCRAFLATTWLRCGWWLMQDHLIARLLPKPCTGFSSRQAITRAVKELGLVKHPDTARAPRVKDLGPGGVFIFREGYPPKS
jgi:hypothetical protein